jgi:archaellum component FlaC
MSEKAIEMLTKMRLLNKRLQKQSKKMKAESEKCREKARDYLTRGEEEAAKEFLLQSMNYKKWAEGIDKFQIKIESLSMRLQQSRLVADFGEITKELATSLTGLSNNVSAPEIQKYMQEIDLNIGDYVKVQEQVTPKIGEQSIGTTKPEDLEMAFSELSAEASLVSGKLPNATSETIAELEKELEKLKK